MTDPAIVTLLRNIRDELSVIRELLTNEQVARGLVVARNPDQDQLRAFIEKKADKE